MHELASVHYSFDTTAWSELDISTSNMVHFMPPIQLCHHLLGCAALPWEMPTPDGNVSFCLFSGAYCSSYSTLLCSKTAYLPAWSKTAGAVQTDLNHIQARQYSVDHTEAGI